MSRTQEPGNDVDVVDAARQELAQLFEKLLVRLEFAIPAGLGQGPLKAQADGRVQDAADYIVEALTTPDLHEEGKLSCIPWLGALTSGEPDSDWRDTATGQLILGAGLPDSE